MRDYSKVCTCMRQSCELLYNEICMVKPQYKYCNDPRYMYNYNKNPCYDEHNLEAQTSSLI